MKAQEKRDVAIIMNTSEYEAFKSARRMLMDIYYAMNDGNIETRAKASADFIDEMLWKITVNDEEEA